MRQTSIQDAPTSGTRSPRPHAVALKTNRRQRRGLERDQVRHLHRQQPGRGFDYARQQVGIFDIYRLIERLGKVFFRERISPRPPRPLSLICASKSTTIDNRLTAIERFSLAISRPCSGVIPAVIGRKFRCSKNRELAHPTG